MEQPTPPPAKPAKGKAAEKAAKRAANKAAWAARPKTKATKVAAKPKKAKVGIKPCVAYSPEIAARICEGVADCKSLETICKGPNMPSKRAVIMWQRDYPEFARALDQARELRADARIEAIHDISNRVLKGEIDPHAARVGLDNLWKLAGRENWRRWGDRQALAVAMQVATPDEAVGQQGTTATDAFVRRLRQLADRHEQGFGRVQDGITLIPPPAPAPPTKADTINRVPDRVIDNDP